MGHPVKEQNKLHRAIAKHSSKDLRNSKNIIQELNNSIIQQQQLHFNNRNYISSTVSWFLLGLFLAVELAFLAATVVALTVASFHNTVVALTKKKQQNISGTGSNCLSLCTVVALTKQKQIIVALVVASFHRTVVALTKMNK